MSLQPLRVAFMGTPQFAVPCLQALTENPDLVTVVAVYTQPDKPAGRGQKLTPPPIKVEALKYGYSVYQPENINKNDEPRKLADLMVDLVIVVAYAQFLGKAVLNTPRLGCINVHSSLLPKYRGAAPIQFAIWKGEKETGVTIMKLVSKMDAGPMLLQRSMPIGEKMTAGELHDQLSQIGAQALIEALRGLQAGTIQEVEQDEAKATYATLITKEMGRIDWQKPGYEILCQMKALTPWPGSFCNTTRGLLKVLQGAFHKTLPGAHESEPFGSVFLGASGVFVRCKDGWIELKQVQLEGKKPVNGFDFLNGLRQGTPFQILNDLDLKENT